MRRLSIVLPTLLAMLTAALPALAAEGEPLANSVLLPGTVGWGLVILAVVLVVVFRLWAGRGPN